MGLLDGLLGNVLGSVLGGGQQAQDPKAVLVQSVLGMLLNQGGQSSQGGLGGMLGGLAGALGGGGNAAAGGGSGALGGLLEAFTKSGMGEQAGSWVGKGENMPISADQLSQVLGSLGGGSGAGGGLGDILGQLAGQAGVSREDAAGHLSELLPSIVDKLTPNGELPQAGNMGDLGSIMAQVLGK